MDHMIVDNDPRVVAGRETKDLCADISLLQAEDPTFCDNIPKNQDRTSPASGGNTLTMADNPKNKGCIITLFWLEQSRAHRILWLLEELGLSYELKIFKRVKMLAPKELKAIHPLGKSPVVKVEGPTGQPKVIAESALIVEYLTEHFGPQYLPKKFPDGAEPAPGAETEEYMRNRYFLHYAEGSIMSPLVMSLVISQLKGPMVPFVVRPITRIVAGQIEAQFLSPQLQGHFDFLEAELTKSGDFFTGPDLAAADFMMIYPIEAGIFGGLIRKEKYPKLSSYVERLHSREAYKKGVSVVEQKTGEKLSMFPSMPK